MPRMTCTLGPYCMGDGRKQKKMDKRTWKGTNLGRKRENIDYIGAPHKKIYI